jgi:rare lipoprotein A (peptidoglycan hydrolase)
MHTAVIFVGLLGLSLMGVIVQGEARPSDSVQVGQASWYGPFHHGRPTANGERFSMYRMTAAHRTLPLGTIVAVTNLQTGQRVTVRINDRGPYVDPKRRIIDLSRAVARRLGLEHPGLGRVRVTVVQRAPASPKSVAAPPRASRTPLSRLARQLPDNSHGYRDSSSTMRAQTGGAMEVRPRARRNAFLPSWLYTPQKLSSGRRSHVHSSPADVPENNAAVAQSRNRLYPEVTGSLGQDSYPTKRRVGAESLHLERFSLECMVHLTEKRLAAKENYSGVCTSAREPL